MRKLNAKERRFWNNAPNAAKVYYRSDGILRVGYWHLGDGDCTNMFCDFDEFKLKVLQIAYYRVR